MKPRKNAVFGSLQLYQIVTNIARVYDKFLRFFSTISCAKMSKARKARGRFRSVLEYIRLFLYHAVDFSPILDTILGIVFVIVFYLFTICY